MTLSRFHTEVADRIEDLGLHTGHTLHVQHEQSGMNRW